MYWKIPNIGSNNVILLVEIIDLNNKKRKLICLPSFLILKDVSTLSVTLKDDLANVQSWTYKLKALPNWVENIKTQSLPPDII